ncbi:hypothetical protein TrVE_jg1732 [Triparma verrucosa]|uniref:1-alkyl-2-acetylglycerophosphocholine esterase n=1 Tax=Triparma verrucosa TaxID=1606542 RepID=A0A9W7EM51_9STRA|nr:hypothetical protein TrVE_jg1732 [Triparma verrucosa]
MYLKLLLLFLSLLFLAEETHTYNVGYTARTLQVKSTSVPLAIWSPTFKTASASSTPAIYDYSISVSRIAKLLIGLPLPTFPFMLKKFSIPSRPLDASYAVLNCAEIAHSSPRPLVIVSHGYLGSRFDLTLFCEKLASAGNVVCAPEFPESLSASYDTNWNSEEERVTREAIVDRAIDTLRSSYNISSIGFLGHSLGTGLTMNYPGDGPRCVIAGFRGLTSASSNSKLLVVASDKDSVCPGSYIRERVKEAEEASPNVESLFSHNFNHISYLSEATNDGMVEFLSPLLPIAKSLKIPLLDFDVYSDVKDSNECAEETIPVVVKFFSDSFKF